MPKAAMRAASTPAQAMGLQVSMRNSSAVNLNKQLRAVQRSAPFQPLTRVVGKCRHACTSQLQQAELCLYKVDAGETVDDVKSCGSALQGGQGLSTVRLCRTATCENNQAQTGYVFATLVAMCMTANLTVNGAMALLCAHICPR